MLDTVLTAACMCTCVWRSFIERGRFAEGWTALREIRGPFFDSYQEFLSIVRAAAVVPHVSVIV